MSLSLLDSAQSYDEFVLWPTSGICGILRAMRPRCFDILMTVLCLTTVGSCQNHTMWQIEVVDGSGGAGAFSSLVIDRSGNLHLAYSNQARTALRYAFRARAQKRWDKTTIDQMGGSFEALAVDSHGSAHIAYNSPKSIGLHYASWDGKQWQKILIDPAKTGHQTSIQLDSNGNPRISYYLEEFSDHRAAKCLKYAYFDGKAWYIQTVDHRPGTGSWNSIALDHADRPYISYSIATGNLGFAYLDQSKWEHSLARVQDSKSKRYVVSHSSLTIGADGEPHVAYINGTERTINYAWRVGATWHQETVDSLAATGADADHVSLKLDRNGHPHVVYYDSGLGLLKYSTRDKKEWHSETIDEGDAGQYLSLSLDENDQPYVSYYTSACKELRVAHRPFLDSVAAQ
jgi:hypothetical protein